LLNEIDPLGRGENGFHIEVGSTGQDDEDERGGGFSAQASHRIANLRG
jgi:hypothetical protein